MSAKAPRVYVVFSHEQDTAEVIIDLVPAKSAVAARDRIARARDYAVVCWVLTRPQLAAWTRRVLAFPALKCEKAIRELEREDGPVSW